MTDPVTKNTVENDVSETIIFSNVSASKVVQVAVCFLTKRGQKS